MTEQSKFPVILIPGIFGYGEENQLVNKVFPYFGMTSASAARVIAEVGNPVHTASFRPLSGVWERACELYAQIKGGKVDYGKAYAEKHISPSMESPIPAGFRTGARRASK